jgi:uncharacterized protein with PIN domain
VIEGKNEPLSSIYVLEQTMKLTVDNLKRIVRSIATTEDEEIGCEECFHEVDRFAEMKLAGKNVAEAMPLVQAHLERCEHCRQEYEALLDALKAISV